LGYFLENGDECIDDALVDDREKEQQRGDALVESLGDERRVLDVKVRSLSEENELRAHVSFGRSAFEEAEDDANERGCEGTGRRRFF